MKTLWKVIAVLASLGQMYVLFWTMERRYILHYADVKYVGFRLNGGRLGNQLFHFVTGYGIARTLNRVHYLPSSEWQSRVQKYLDLFKKVFPHLEETYVQPRYWVKAYYHNPAATLHQVPRYQVLGSTICYPFACSDDYYSHSWSAIQNVINETVVPFAASCCVYEDPRKLLNHSAKYLLLDFDMGQNPRFFEEYYDDIRRRVLKFSSYIRKEGNYIIDSLKICYEYSSERSSRTCIHIRRTDFIPMNVSTDIDKTVRAANSIARRVGTSKFLIFGDDRTFMKDLGAAIVEKGNWKKDAVTISEYSEPIDIYLTSQLCRSFLISAATSTFGWWLAFFVADQNAVFYASDERRMNSKVPSKELFMTSWQKI